MIPIILDMIFISIIPISISKIYQNINNEIQLSKISQIKSIDIKSYEEYANYLKNSDFIISLFHVFWCGHCNQFKPIFDKASSYDILNKKWLFLKIDCSAYSYICNILNVQFYPTIKIYKGKKNLYKDPPRELKPLLHFLYKISDNPLIPINSKNNFFEKYGEYSPLIEYNKNNNESEFMKCIHNLSNNEFLEDFYFGIYKSKNNKEKIIFDYNSINSSDIVYEWNGNCTMAFDFLFLNKYPLMTEINQNFLEEISNDFRTVIFVVTFMTNKIINNFVFTSLKNLSYKKRKYIFGFADYNSDIYISKFFNFNLNNNNEMKLIIYDFNKRVYYIHDKLFNFEKQNEKDIINEIQNLINNLDELKFTTGSKLRDLFSFINFDEMNPYEQVIVVGIFVLILLGFIFLLFHFSKTEDEKDDQEDEFDEFIDDINDVKEKNNLNKENKKNEENQNKEDKSKKQKID